MRSSHSCKVGIMSVSIVFAVFLFSSSFGEAARPISVPKRDDRPGPHQRNDRLMKLFDELLIGDVKNSGPSPGVGHKYPTSAATLGGIKIASTPSLKRILGGIKDTDNGPSPGVGHKYTDSRRLSATVKDSGPSPGVGH